MLSICPACGNKKGLEIIRRPDDIEVKGEKITIDIPYYSCENCGNDFDDPDEFGDPIKIAYNEYRRIKGMVQPDEIISFREKFGLTQKELSDLLGFGGVTLSRYENGSLQDQAHDNALRLALDTRNLFRLMQVNRAIFSEEKYDQIVSRIKPELNMFDLIEEVFVESPDEYNGFQKLNLRKVKEVINLFCHNREIFKTKLMKLLFYSDFLYYKNFHTSITGMQYVHYPYGPVPYGYEIILGTILQTDKSFRLEPREFGNKCGEVIVVDNPSSTKLFSEDELNILKTVNHKFKYYSSKEISLVSHKEIGYILTKRNDLISYNFADEIEM